MKIKKFTKEEIENFKNGSVNLLEFMEREMEEVRLERAIYFVEKLIRYDLAMKNKEGQ